jgi:hypothetical protein
MSRKKPQRGGAREGAGRKASAPTATHPVRCTDEGWTWLQSKASGKGHTSVGKWADSAGRKAPKRKGNVKGEQPAVGTAHQNQN